MKQGINLALWMVTTIFLCTVSNQGFAEENFFDQPDSLCSSLVAGGISTGGWKPSRALPGEWLCMSNMISFGAMGANGMENNIAFYAYGTDANRVNDVRIKININNSSGRKEAFSRLERATRSLFAAMSEPVPEELSVALENQEPVSVRLPYGVVELVLEPGRIDSFKVVLTDTRYLAARERTKNLSAGDFSSCKKAVADAVNYSISLLSGDGEPVRETGYKSFMLKGRGKDLFFCEVHPGQRFKIKAALNGKFPFRYIAEGVF